MSHINVYRSHNLSPEKARAAAEEVASHLNRRFDLNYHWQENSLYFERTGVSGRMDIEEQAVRVTVRLGFLLLPLRSKFEQEIHRYMDRIFEG